MRSSTLQDNTATALIREIGSKYDYVVLLAERLDEIEKIAAAIDAGTLDAAATVVAEPLVSSIITVSSISADVQAVAAGAANIDTLVPYVLDIEVIANNISTVTWLSDNIGTIETIAANVVPMSTVATNIVDVNTVALNITDISEVASTVVPNIAEILLADDNAATATTKAAEASVSASNALTSATNAAGSEASATLSATNAGVSATSAQASATSASTSATAAGISETVALGYSQSAEASKNAAALSASNANTSASNASISETNAAASEVSASTSANSASASASSAFASETNASISAGQASTSASNANISEANAATSAATATTQAGIATVALETFQGQYYSGLVEPVTPDIGDLWFDENTTTMKVYDGVAFVAAYVSLGDALLNSNNLSDLDDVIQARVNLGLPALFDAKQDTLVNQTNIKSINGDSILGSGDLVVSAGSGGYAANVYLTTQVSSTVGTYSQISYSPEVAETILSTIVNNNTILIEDYIFDGDVLASVIPAGEWGFHLHRRVDNTAGDTVITFEVYSRASGGTETILFTASTKSIEDTVFAREDILVTKPTYTINPTDRVGVKVYASTTRTSDVTVYLKIGDGEAAYFNTPLEIRHNQLRARDVSDAHPISSITGLQTELDGKEPADNTILKEADIGLTVQGYNSNTVIDGSYVHTDNNYTTLEKAKLSGIEPEATADQTKEDIDALGINAATVNGLTVETAVPVGAVFTDTVIPLNDTLISTSTAEALTANQGKVLKDLTDSKLNKTNPVITGSITEEDYNLTGTEINPENGTSQYKTITGNTIFTETLVNGQSLTLHLFDADLYALTFPTITWEDATYPMLSSNEVLIFWKSNNVFYGKSGGKFV